ASSSMKRICMALPHAVSCAMGDAVWTADDPPSPTPSRRQQWRTQSRLNLVDSLRPGGLNYTDRQTCRRAECDHLSQFAVYQPRECPISCSFRHRDDAASGVIEVKQLHLKNDC